MSNILQKDIPRVKDLCDSLGFRTGSDRPHFQLADHTHEWRRHFRTEDGIPGTELKEWRNPTHQNGLESMTQAFLDNRGEVLWPASTGFVEYESEKPLITSLVKQLFWRQNTNEARNAGFYLARDPDHQGDPIIRHRRSKQSPSPNVDFDGSPRLPPASQLSNFRAKLDPVSSRISHTVLDEPELDGLLWRNPYFGEPELTDRPTAFVRPQTAKTGSKRSRVEDRKDDPGLAPIPRDRTPPLDERDIYNVSSDNEDNTPSEGRLKKKTSPKNSNKVTTPKKEKNLPGASADRDSDDGVPRDKKKVKVNHQKTQEPLKAKPASSSKLSPRTSSSDQEKREARRCMRKKDSKSSGSGMSSMRKASTGSKAQDRPQDRDPLLTQLPIKQPGDTEHVQPVNTRPKADASARTTMQSNKARDDRPANLPRSSDGKANTHSKDDTSARTTMQSNRARDNRPANLPRSSDGKAKTHSKDDASAPTTTQSDKGVDNQLVDERDDTHSKDDSSAQITMQGNEVLDNRSLKLPPSTGGRASSDLLPQPESDAQNPHPNGVESSSPDTEMQTDPPNVEISKPPNILSSPANAERQILAETPSHNDQDQLPDKSNNPNSTVKREDPSRSPTIQTDPDRGRSKAPNTSNSASGVNIRFTIIKARHPRLQIVRWSNGSLSAHNVLSLFREISQLTGRPNIAHITFKLITSCADIENRIQAKDDEDFHSMRNDFMKYIRDDIRQTKNREFSVELALDPEDNDQRSSKAEEKEEVRAEEDDEPILL